MKRVLVVPDRLISDEMGASFFDRHSFVVRSAQHASQAVFVARAFRPDLVILHSDLSGASAFELCRALRTGHPGVRILLIHELIGDLEEDYGTLVSARLVQPITPEQLLSTIAALLEIRVRRGPRAHLDSLVQLTGFGVPADGELSLANAIDISEYGMLIETGTQLELERDGVVEFFLPGAKQRLSIRAVARVTLDEVLLRYAIEFDDVSESARDDLRRYVDSQRHERAHEEPTR